MYEELYFYQLFLICSIPLVLIVSYYIWKERREKERERDKKIKQLEEKVAEIEKNTHSDK